MSVRVTGNNPGNKPGRIRLNGTERPGATVEENRNLSNHAEGLANPSKLRVAGSSPAYRSLSPIPLAGGS